MRRRQLPSLQDTGSGSRSTPTKRSVRTRGGPLPRNTKCNSEEPKKANVRPYLRGIQKPPESFKQTITALLLGPELVALGDSPLR